MAVCKFGLKLYQVNYGSENIKINIKEGDTAVISDLEITAKESSSPQEVVWTSTADFEDTKSFTVEIANSGDLDVAGWIASTEWAHLLQYGDGNYYQGPWRGEHAGDAGNPWPVGKTGGASGSLISGVKEIDRPADEYFDTSAEQQSAGAPAQQTKYIVKDTDGNTLNWEAYVQNAEADYNNTYEIVVSNRFLSSV